MSIVSLPVRSVHAATATDVRTKAIAWLERSQNEDGSWNEADRGPAVTAEALLALAKAGRGNATAAQRAKSWLLAQELTSSDLRGRAIRGLDAAGVGTSLRASVLSAEASTDGWGMVASTPATSYDSAIVLSALFEAGSSIPDAPGKLTAIFSRRRPDQGWSGDGIPVTGNGIPAGDDANSDRTVTAEIVRALAGVAAANGQSGALASSVNFLRSSAAPPGTDLLETASRLAAIHATGSTDTALEAELLDDNNLTNGLWSQTDAHVNAIGLLAVVTKPQATYSSPCPENWDCDSADDDDDAFPFDEDEQTDTDGDGQGDGADLDDDGDGVPYGCPSLFPRGIGRNSDLPDTKM